MFPLEWLSLGGSLGLDISNGCRASTFGLSNDTVLGCLSFLDHHWAGRSWHLGLPGCRQFWHLGLLGSRQLWLLWWIWLPGTRSDEVPYLVPRWPSAAGHLWMPLVVSSSLWVLLAFPWSSMGSAGGSDTLWPRSCSDGRDVWWEFPLRMLLPSLHLPGMMCLLTEVVPLTSEVEA